MTTDSFVIVLVVSPETEVTAAAGESSLHRVDFPFPLCRRESHFGAFPQEGGGGDTKIAPSI